MEQFRQWAGYRASLPAIEELKEAVAERVLAAGVEGLTAEESAELAARRTVELLTGSLKSRLTPDDLKRCAGKIRAHTRA